MEEHSDAEIAARLFPDQETFKARGARRFALLEAHWDVPLEPRPLGRSRGAAVGLAPSGIDRVDRRTAEDPAHPCHRSES